VTNRAPDGLGESQPNDLLDLRAQSQMLRRKVLFWKRTAWLLVGVVVVSIVVVWQRSEIRRRECRVAIERYAKLAHEQDLRLEPEVLIETQWQHLDQDSVHLSPSHYVLFVQNWLRIPSSDEPIPLAICADSHSTLMGSGRHVLFYGPDGYRIEWLPETQAAELLRQVHRLRATE